MGSLFAVPRASLVAWAVAVCLFGYIWYATLDWEVPSPGWIRFGPLWLGVTAVLAGGWLAVGRRLTPIALMALAAVAAMALTDIAYTASQNMRDLHIYLRAGRHFLDGEAVYLHELVTQRPADLSTYPFLYPPLTLPFFALLALLPGVLVDLGWLVASIAAAVAALWYFGIRRRIWIAALLLWPPIFQGIQVGNVAVLVGLLFALAPWFGAGLVLAAVFKLYSGLAAFWLVRERRLLQLVVGVGIVVGAGLVTLPLTGVERWVEWLDGLNWYRASQPLLPASLYGFGLPRYVPFVPFVAVAVATSVAALSARGHAALARLGLATIVASPSLYAHGVIVGLPAFLYLDTLWLWAALGITSVAPGLGWWMAFALVVLAWIVPRLTRAGGPGGDDEGLHPLGRFREPWPTRP